jgi:hypothetical protein
MKGENQGAATRPNAFLCASQRTAQVESVDKQVANEGSQWRTHKLRSRPMAEG